MSMKAEFAMTSKIAIGGWVLLGLALCSWGQQPPAEQTSTPTVKSQGPGAGHDIGSGAGDVGKGAAKGTGELAKGTAKGAVTLHPIDATAAIGKGAVVAGKDATVGTAKGAGKITRGIGKGLKKIL